MSDLASLFAREAYADVIAALSGQVPTDPAQLRWLGLAHLRLGQTGEAGPLLARAAAAGDAEATVEYGNWLRLRGQLVAAEAHLRRHAASLSGELHLRALRWLGVTLFLLDQVAEGLRLCEQAWAGYQAAGDPVRAARTAQNLALMCKDTGQWRRCETLLLSALEVQRDLDPASVFNTTKTLADLYLQQGRSDDAGRLLAEIEPLSAGLTTDLQLHYRSSLAVLAEHRGDLTGHRREVEAIHAAATAQELYSLRLWSTVQLMDLHSRAGDFDAALALYHDLAGAGSAEVSTELRVARAIVHRRRGQTSLAIADLQAARDERAGRAAGADHTKIALHLAYAYFLEGRFEDTAGVLRGALEDLSRLPLPTGYRPALQEMSALLHHAAASPSLAPYLEPIMEHLADLISGGAEAPAPTIRLQLYTLGQASLVLGGEPVHLALRGSLALLTHLALHPGRTRAELQADLYAGKDPAASAAYIRQSVRDLRASLGGAVIVREGPHNQPRYRLGPGVQLDLDLERFYAAVDAGDLPRALALYRGPLLPDVVDVPWVVQARQTAHQALLFELRTQLLVQREAGEWRRVILLAGQLLRLDPADLEAHQWRLQAARAGGSTPAELARFTAAAQSAAPSDDAN